MRRGDVQSSRGGGTGRVYACSGCRVPQAERAVWCRLCERQATEPGEDEPREWPPREAASYLGGGPSVADLKAGRHAVNLSAGSGGDAITAELAAFLGVPVVPLVGFTFTDAARWVEAQGRGGAK